MKQQHQQQQSESNVVELGAGVAGVGQDQEQQQQQETEASRETPRTPPSHASSVQKHQQSESEVVKLAGDDVGELVFLGGDSGSWNRRGFRRNCAYAEQQQREYGGGAGGDEAAVAAAGVLRPVRRVNVPFRPRERG